MGIEAGAQAGDEVGEGFGEVAVFAAAEAVAGHDDAAAKAVVAGIEGDQMFALGAGEEVGGERAAVGVEVAVELRPGDGGQAVGEVGGRGGVGGHARQRGAAPGRRHSAACA